MPEAFRITLELGPETMELARQAVAVARLAALTFGALCLARIFKYLTGRSK